VAARFQSVVSGTLGLHATPPRVTPGRPREWGQRNVAPECHARWDTRWQPGNACLYGPVRRFRVKRRRWHWPASGPEVPVHRFVFEAAGYPKPWFLVTGAPKLSAAWVVELFTAPAA